MQNRYSVLRISGVIVLCYFSYILYYCPDHNSKTIRAINVKLNRWKNLSEKKCSAKEQLICASYFWSYYPLFFILKSCPDHNSKYMRAINLLVNISHLEEVQCKRTVTCSLYFWSYYPLLFFILHPCPDHNSYPIRAINWKFHMWINLIEEKCSAQELLLCT